MDATMQKKLIDRRAALQSIVLGLGAVSFARVIAACSAPSPNANELGSSGGADNDGNKGKAPTPTDADEHVPGKSTPVETGSDAPKVPVQSWESRVKQLEAEQQRQYSRAAFARGDAGIWSGKENSHEPRVSLLKDGATVRVEVVVEHVMGTNALDAGATAPKPDAAAALPEAGISSREAGAPLLDAGQPDVYVPPATPTQTHYITTIYLRANVDGVDRVVGLWEFSSGDAAPPTVRFTLPAGVKEVVAYEWCTLHGLWKAPALAIAA